MKTRDEKVAAHLANRLVLLKTKPTKEEWMEEALRRNRMARAEFYNNGKSDIKNGEGEV